jgi:hypothetical protein
MAVDVTSAKPVNPATFHPFPRLPQELQYAIWDIACKAQQAEGRVLFIAFDGTDDRTIEAASTVQLRIARFANHPISVPSLLHTCRYTRYLSLKTYDLWPFVNERLSDQAGSMLYVNKESDVFLFRDELENCWFLDTLTKDSDDPQQIEADATARCQFIEQTSGIKTYAFASALMENMIYMRHFSWCMDLQAQTFIIVITDEAAPFSWHVNRCRSSTSTINEWDPLADELLALLIDFKEELKGLADYDCEPPKIIAITSDYAKRDMEAHGYCEDDNSSTWVSLAL